MKQTIPIYLALLAAFAVAIFFLIQKGRNLPPPMAAPGSAMVVSAPKPAAPTATSDPIWVALRENAKDPLGRLLLQVIVIVLATRAVGAVFTRCGQPAVVGEVLAGILLGPSLLGWLWPGATEFLFPNESLGVLKLLSQIGVCLFMFVVGLELETGRLREKAHTAVLVSHMSIAFPYLLGVASALLLYTDYARAGASFPAFALFMGIALSITAFPVLARILAERGLAKTYVGSMAITCAAVDDATAWGILAFVVAIARATSLVSTAFCLGLAFVFVALMLMAIRPKLPAWLGVARITEGTPSRTALVASLLFLLTSAWATELIGLHALFGAFLAGVVMPANPQFREYLTVRLESFSALFLLPLFFAYSGLRTQIGLLNDATSWLICLGIIGLAILGKLGGTMLTARATGMNWHDSFVLGALMNTRGLVELVALNIGYDLGILSPQIFAMLVIMALVTTFLTGPLLNLAAFAQRRTQPGPAAA